MSQASSDTFEDGVRSDEGVSVKKDHEQSILSAEELQCWSSVREDPNDFQSWIKLLQFAETKEQSSRGREAYEQFLKRYPFCYGYWKKFSDYEKKHSGMDEARKIFERGLKAVPLSIDLWIHYINFTIQLVKNGDKIVRETFEKALNQCGLDYRSDRLWESFIDWEKSKGNWRNVMKLYERLLDTPVQNSQTHFKNFLQFVNSQPPKDILEPEELTSLTDELGLKVPQPAKKKQESDDTKPPGCEDEGEASEGWEEDEDVAPPGEEDKPSVPFTSTDPGDPMIAKLRERIIEQREIKHSQTLTEVNKRKQFELGIKRPYFHAKPLDKAQLQTWRDYLDFEISNGSKKRILFLFERCIIACAMYEEFWIKFLNYLESSDVEYASQIFRQACTTHCQDNIKLHMKWVLLELKRGNTDEARQVLQRLETIQPNAVLMRLHRIALERQLGNFPEALKLFTESINDTEDTETKMFYLKRMSSFVAKVMKDMREARKTVKKALAIDSANESIYLHWLDLELANPVENEKFILDCFEAALDSNLGSSEKAMFRQRRLQYLQEFGSTLERVLAGYEEYQDITGSTAPGIFPKKRTVNDTDEGSTPSKKPKPEGFHSAEPGSSSEISQTLPQEPDSPEEEGMSTEAAGSQPSATEQTYSDEWTKYQQQLSAYYSATGQQQAQAQAQSYAQAQQAYTQAQQYQQYQQYYAQYGMYPQANSQYASQYGTSGYQ